MAVERRARDAQPLADGAQRDPVDSLFSNRPRGFGEKRAAQIAMVIGGGGLPLRGVCGRHDASVARSVDVVNICGYPMLTMTTLRRLYTTDAPLTVTGLLMAVALIPALAGLWLDPRIITGAPAWLTPAEFAMSTAIYALTLAWIFTYLPDWLRTRRIVGRGSAAILVFEVGAIYLQAWRGTTSHFNLATPFDAALFTTMGLAIVIQTLGAAMIAV